MSVGNTRSGSAHGLGLAALLLCVALLSAAAPARAASAPRDLGGPDVSGYCQHLGFSGASYTAPPNQSWQCLHADGSTSSADMQAACEFSFSERPILAKQLTPGVLLTWQCLQSSGGAGPGGGAGQPTAAQLKSALLKALRPRGNAAKIATLKRKSAYPMRFGALVAGSIRVSWSYKASKAKPITLAAGRAAISRAGTVTVKIGLTTAGRRLLKHAGHIRITAKGTFLVAGQPAIVAAQAVTLAR